MTVYLHAVTFYQLIFASSGKQRIMQGYVQHGKAKLKNDG